MVSLAEMKLCATVVDLQLWVDRAQLAQITFFRPRKDLWKRFANILNNKEDVQSAVSGYVEITHDQFAAIQSTLMTRNQSLTDEKIYSFQKALLELQEELDASEAPGESE